MGKKGFSLVEIIVVIALIALVSTLVLVNMNGIQQNTNEVEIKRFEDKISSAACQYVDRGSDLVLSTNTNCSTDARLTTRDDCKENSGGCFVCLKTLIEEGLIDKDSIDPSNNKKVIDEQTAVRIRVKWIDEGNTKKKVCTFEGDDHDGGGGSNPSPSISVDTRKRKVYFDYNGGYGSETSRDVTENSKIGTLPTGTRTNYVIDYWYYSTDESKHASADDTVGNSDILLKAHWILSERTLTYDSQGGSGCSVTKGNLGEKWGTLCSTSRSGYTFGGWYEGKEGSGKQITETSTVEDNLTVYAKWTQITYTLTINPNGGSYSGSTSITKPMNSTYTPSTPTRTNYKFNGWSKSGGGSWNGSTFTFTGNGTLTANWTYSTYTLTYDSQGGTTCSSKTGTLGSSWGYLCEPKKGNYAFGGWFTGRNGTGTPITSSTTVTGNQTVYAYWFTYKLTIRNNTYNYYWPLYDNQYWEVVGARADPEDCDMPNGGCTVLVTGEDEEGPYDYGGSADGYKYIRRPYNDKFYIYLATVDTYVADNSARSTYYPNIVLNNYSCTGATLSVYESYYFHPDPRRNPRFCSNYFCGDYSFSYPGIYDHVIRYKVNMTAREATCVFNFGKLEGLIEDDVLIEDDILIG